MGKEIERNKKPFAIRSLAKSHLPLQRANKSHHQNRGVIRRAWANVV